MGIYWKLERPLVFEKSAKMAKNKEILKEVYVK